MTYVNTLEIALTARPLLKLIDLLLSFNISLFSTEISYRIPP